ncbi:MAG: hypothetical protein NT051_02175 [Candidatus Micrarchaeota archaeon]|nr:hypothetical protein [Candidatus Micrarchaeota archaeon]
MKHARTNADEKSRQGFLFSFEAALSAALLIIAIAFLPLFEKQPGNQPALLTCHDVAGVLAKSGAFESQLALDRDVSRASSLLKACIEASTDSLSSGKCGSIGEKKDAIAFSFPVWSDGAIRQAKISCYQ